MHLGGILGIYSNCATSAAHALTAMLTHTHTNIVKSWEITSLNRRCGVEAVVEAEVGGTGRGPAG